MKNFRTLFSAALLLISLPGFTAPLFSGRVAAASPVRLNFAPDWTPEQTALLRIRVCRTASKTGRSQFLLTVKVNDRTVSPALPPLRRLLNRKVFAPAESMKNAVPRHGDPAETLHMLYRQNVGGYTKKQAETNTECKDGVWRVWFAPTLRLNRRQGELLCYEFDISDLLKPGENVLTFINQDNPGGVSPNNQTDKALRLEAVLDVVPGRSPLLRRVPERFGEALPRPAAGQNGGETIWQNERGTVFTTRAELDVRRAAAPEERSSVQWRRELHRHPDGVFSITDHLTNPGREPVLVQITDFQIFANDFAELLAGGLPYPHCLGTAKTLESTSGKSWMLWRRFKTNPSLFIRSAEGLGAGFILRDAASRNHHAFDPLEPEKRSAGWIRGFYRLQPGEKRTLEYQVFLAARSDYYGFINAVRAKWDLNRVVMPHQVCFADLEYLLKTPVKTLKRQLEFHRAGAVIVWGGYVWPPKTSPGPRDIIYGAALMNEPCSRVLAQLAAAGRKLKQADPRVKFLPYIHLTLAGPLTPEETTRFAREICFLPDGKPWARCWGSAKNRDLKRNTASYSMIPLPNGAYGKAMRETFFAMRRATGADGFFLDEFGGEFYDFKHDSNFVELDRDNRARMVRTVGFHGNPFVAGLLKEGRAQKMEFWGNGGNLNLQLGDAITFCPVFSEARLNLWQPPRTVHLNTPAALWYRPITRTIRMLLQHGLLPVGTALTWKNNLTRELFPITPATIGAGFVIGREALISAVALPVPADFTACETVVTQGFPDDTTRSHPARFRPGDTIPVPRDGFVILRRR